MCDKIVRSSLQPLGLPLNISLPLGSNHWVSCLPAIYRLDGARGREESCRSYSYSTLSCYPIQMTRHPRALPYNLSIATSAYVTAGPELGAEG